jgi:hypothetical protein
VMPLLILAAASCCGILSRVGCQRLAIGKLAEQ